MAELHLYPVVVCEWRGSLEGECYDFCMEQDVKHRKEKQGDFMISC